MIQQQSSLVCRSRWGRVYTNHINMIRYKAKLSGTQHHDGHWRYCCTSGVQMNPNYRDSFTYRNDIRLQSYYIQQYQFTRTYTSKYVVQRSSAACSTYTKQGSRGTADRNSGAECSVKLSSKKKVNPYEYARVQKQQKCRQHAMQVHCFCCCCPAFLLA